MNIKIKALLIPLLFALAGQLAFGVDEKEVNVKPLYADRFDPANLLLDEGLTKTTMVSNQSIEALVEFIFARRTLPFEELNVLLDGFYGEKDGKPFDHVDMMADIYYRLGATKVFRGARTSKGIDPFVKAIAEVYPQNAIPVGVVYSATDYLQSKSLADTLYVEAGTSLSIAERVNQGLPVKQFGRVVHVILPNLSEPLIDLYGKQKASILMGQTTYGKPWVSSSKDLNPPKGLYINTINSEDPYFRPFFAELDKIILEPTGHNLTYFIKRQSQLLLKKYQDEVAPELRDKFLAQLSFLLDEEGFERIRRINKIQRDYKLGEDRVTRLAKEISASLTLTIPMIHGLVEYLVFRTQGQAVFPTQHGGATVLNPIRGGKALAFGRSEGGVSDPFPVGMDRLSDKDALIADLQIMADLFTGKLQFPWQQKPENFRLVPYQMVD